MFSLGTNCNKFSLISTIKWFVLVKSSIYFSFVYITTLSTCYSRDLWYIDISLSSDGNIYHGILGTSSTLKSVFETVAIFLKEQNTEGIIMRLSYHQNDRCTKSDCYEKNVIHVLQ